MSDDPHASWQQELYRLLRQRPPKRPPSEREILMEQLGWPTETLTLEELRERVSAQQAEK